MQKIFWSQLEFEHLLLYVAATEKGLCYVGSPSQPFSELEAVMHKRFKDVEFVENKEVLAPYLHELTEFFKGNSKMFSLPLDVKGTPFQEEIWAALQKIPYGTTLSYSEIAELIGRPTATRAAGAAIGANPVMVVVPCHRVIGKNGAITGFRGGIEMKEYLLDLERRHG